MATVSTREWRIRNGSAPVEIYSADCPREAASLFFRDGDSSGGRVVRVTGEPGMPGVFEYLMPQRDGSLTATGRVTVWQA